eukprot:53493-Eustigmatos_ZCMA.PRE.1
MLGAVGLLDWKMAHADVLTSLQGQHAPPSAVGLDAMHCPIRVVHAIYTHLPCPSHSHMSVQAVACGRMSH